MVALSLLLLGELLFLFFLSDRITRSLYAIFYLIFRNRHVASGILTFLYLPGTAIHELSHLIVAEILRVPTGELSLTPTVAKNDAGQDEIRAGYLKIGKTDVLRRFLVGVAPLILGLGALVVLVLLFDRFWIQMTDWKYQLLLISVISYFLFSVSINMFSSKKDLEDAPYLLPAVALFVTALIITAYFAGVRLSLTGTALTITLTVLSGLTRALGIVCGINLLVLTINGLFLRGIEKIQNIQVKL